MSESKDTLLFSTLAKSNIIHRDIFSCRTDDLLQVALGKLHQHHISSLPVFDHVQQQYTAFLDYKCIVSLVLGLLQKQDDLAKVSEQFAKATCQDALKFTLYNWSNSFVHINDGDTVKKAIGTVVGRANIHRLPVFSTSGELVGVLSQSKILEALAPMIHLFPVSAKKVKDFRLGYKEVLSIQSTEPILTAFKLINERKISGIPVMKGTDVIGNVSASDIAVIGADGQNLHKLNESIGSLLSTTQNKNRPIMTSPDTTVADTCKVLVKEHLHRLYVVSDQGTLLGVISLIDIIELLSTHGL